jgi:hypothetical protein
MSDGRGAGGSAAVAGRERLGHQEKVTKLARAVNRGYISPTEGLI